MFETGPSGQAGLRLWGILALVAVLLGGGFFAWLYLGASQEAPPRQIEGIVRAGDPEFDRYAPMVQLRNVKVRMAKSFSGNRMVIFGAFVENSGDRALDVLEVKLLLFNYNELVYEETRLPIQPGRYTPAVQPHQSRGFNLYLEKLPRQWLASRSEMQVSGFRLAEP